MDERSEQAVPLEIFISSSIEDEEQRQKLENHLSVLKHQKLITVWHRSDGRVGQQREEEIYRHLNSAHIILLLISPDFLAADFYSTELMHALKRHEAGTARVIPIILRPVFWNGAPFQELHILPEGARPIQSTHWFSTDEAWRHVVDQLRIVVEKLRADAVRQITLCFSSPGDTVEERQLVRQVVEKLNQDGSSKSQAHINIIIRDDQDIYHSILASPTPPIKPSQCDIVIVLFWSHMGTPLPGEIVKKDGTGYASTNEWDYEEAVNSAKRNAGQPTVLVYRNCMSPIQADETNFRETYTHLLKVNHFFTQFTHTDSALKGYRSYEQLDQFAHYLEEDLRAALPRLIAQAPAVSPPRVAQETPVQTPTTGDTDELLKSYLNWMIKQHSDLELRGLGGDARLPTIPLEQVYVALKGIRASAYEREQAQQLLLDETFDILADLNEDFSLPELAQLMSYSRNQAVIANPLLPSSRERGRPSQITTASDENDLPITLGEAFRLKRWMVILGDPGSGKTTLARWITLKLAAALLQDEPAVIVRLHQVDPKFDKTATTTIDLGPARLPVLLKVSEFADASQKKRSERETFSLVDFLGYHSWLNQSPPCSQPKLNALIRQYLEKGRAIIILDGMDEMTNAHQREDVIRAIEIFIDDWINARGQKVSAQGKYLLWDRLKREEPAKTGGNQIIITSREVGYGIRPITGQVAHVKIQPMDPVAVEHFCDAWTLAIHRLLYPNEKSDTLHRKATLEADRLKKAIFDPLRPRVRELATNPLLITILALVYHKNQGSLPEQRSELYQEAMKILIDTWRFTKITAKEVEYILSPLAAYIHQNCPKAAIEESDLKAIIKKSLAQFNNEDVAHLPPSFGLKVDDFIRCVREEVGLLAERGKQIYGFLHLTFQEYLTALYLVRDQQHASQEIIEKLDDPRWHEPILMALGHISSAYSDWGSDDREQLLTGVLEADDPLGGRIPRSALLIVTAIPEMERVPEPVVHKIIRRLLTTYADRDGIGQFASLRERISSGLKILYKSKYQRLLVQYLEKAILTIEKGPQNLALASASLLVENEWYSEPLLKALLKAFPYDDAEWEYPITRMLRLRQKHLPVAPHTLPLRQALEQEPELVEYIKSQLPWLRLIVLLYGGISDNGFATHIVQYGEIASVLQLKNELWQYHIDQLRKRPYWQGSWDQDDVVMNLAVHLDTQGGELARQAAAYVPQFTPQAIINDSPLTPLILQTLRQKNPSSVLKHRLWQAWQTADQDIVRAYTLLALLVIDTSQAMHTLVHSLKNAATSALATLVLDLLRQRKYMLADVLTLLGERVGIGQALAPLQDSLTQEQWGDLVAIFFRTFTSVRSLPVKYDDVLLANATSIPRINAEIWAYWLSGLDGSGDASYNYSVILDTVGMRIESASALVHLQLAYNRKYDKLTHWHIPSIPPKYDRYVDSIGEALTVAHQSRSDVLGKLFYLGTILYVSSDAREKNGINYRDYPGLKEDALASALLVPFEFQRELIQLLDAELAQLSVEELMSHVSKSVIAIKDPSIRSRALWRLAQSPYYWQSAYFWNLAVQAAGKITDPLSRSCAFERLIVPLRQSEHIKNEALKAARAIKDPNNRARALARLALYENGTRRWSLLSDALTSASKIGREPDQVDTLQLIYPYLAENHQLHQAYDETIQHLKSDWYRNKGSNVLSTVLLAFHERLHEPQRLTSVIVAALIDDMLGLNAQMRSDDLWSQVLHPVKREQAVSALLKTISVQDLDGLFLTQHAFDVIRSLLDRHEISALYHLLPYLRGFEPALLPFLHLWLDHPPDKIVWVYVGLLLAESGEVNLNTIPCLIELMENGMDFGRYRAGMVLHGSSVFVQKQNRDFRTSQLGEQALLLLARAQQRILPQRVYVGTPLSWVWENIVHDDPLLFQQLVAYVETEEGSERGVADLLRNISYCNTDVLNEIVKQLETGSAKVQELLLDSLFLLSNYHFKPNITPVQQMLIEDVIAELPAHVLENVTVLPERLKTIATLLCSVGKQVDEKEVLFQEALSTLDKKLYALSLKLPASSIDEITKHTLYNLRYDPRNALEAAQMVSENGTSLELLFAWLADCLQEGIDDVSLLYHRTSTLLELAGATTRFSPAAVYQLCAENKLGPALVQAIMYHKSFYGREGAATLLGYLRETPEAFDEALLSGLHDVAEVQTAIVQTMQNLRYLDEHMISKMLHLLEDESASVVYAISKLLVNITRNENIALALRQEIVKALNSAIQRGSSSHPVFVLEKAEAHIYIHNVGRLDQQLYGAIIDIIGIA
jgi:hypothetical protein